MKTVNLKEKEYERLEEIEVLDSKPEDIYRLKVVKEIDPASLPVLAEVKNDSARALNILKQNGYKSKVFCHVNSQRHKSYFSVKSKLWDWDVKPLKKSDYVPEIFKEGLSILQRNNVKIDSVLIAKPKKVESRAGVVKQEFSRQLKAVSNVFLSLFTLTVDVATGLASVPLLELPDPVLLVRINYDIIEIGRWD